MFKASGQGHAEWNFASVLVFLVIANVPKTMSGLVAVGPPHHEHLHVAGKAAFVS